MQSELIVPDSSRGFSSRVFAQGEPSVQPEEFRGRLIDHPEVQILGTREGGKIEAMVPLKLIRADDVPVDHEHVRRIADSMLEITSDGTPRGQDEAVVLAEVVGFNQFYITNGYHRRAAIEVNGERDGKNPEEIGQIPVFATIRTNLTIQEAADARIESAAQQKAVSFARIIEWVDETWRLSKWAEEGIDVHRAFQLRFSSTRPTLEAAQRDGLSTGDIEDIRRWVDEKAKLWKLSATTVWNHLQVARVADPSLIREARGRAGGYRLDAITPHHLSVIAKGLPNQHELQRLAAETAKAQTLTVPYTRSLVDALAYVTSVDEARQVIEDGKWREEAADPYPKPVFIYQDTQTEQELNARDKNIRRAKPQIDALMQMGFVQTRGEAEAMVLAVLDLFDKFPAVKKERGEKLHEAGDRVGYVKILRDGRAIVFSYDSYNGDRRILELVDGISVVGEDSFAGNQNYEYSAEALTECTIQRIFVDDLTKLIRQDARVSAFLLATLAIRKAQQDKRVFDLSTKDASQRVAGAILDITSGIEDLPPMNITQQLIGDLAACVRENVNLILKRLEDKDIIHWERSLGPQLVDRERLHDIYAGH